MKGVLQTTLTDRDVFNSAFMVSRRGIFILGVIGGIIRNIQAV